MNQLRIVFTCMCAYLQCKDQNEVVVVIPDGRPKEGDGGGHGHHGHGGVAPHVAAIQFDPADLKPKSGGLKPHLVFRHGGSRREQAIVFLTGQDLALDPAPAGGLAIRGGRPAGLEAPTSAAEAGDFSWVADVSQLDATSGVMDEECWTGGTSADDRVVARMSLKAGSLSTLVLGSDKRTQRTIVFPFTEPNEANEHPYKQALAAAVAYDVAVPADEVALVLTPFNIGKTPQRLVFSFAGRALGDTLQVLIKNMPLDSLLDVGGAINPDYTPEVDHHFAMYYALSKSVGKRWIPFTGEARPLGPVCSSARFVE